jgi:hypothetical protein
MRVVRWGKDEIVLRRGEAILDVSGSAGECAASLLTPEMTLANPHFSSHEHLVREEIKMDFKRTSHFNAPS